MIMSIQGQLARHLSEGSDSLYVVRSGIFLKFALSLRVEGKMPKDIHNVCHDFPNSFLVGYLFFD